MDAIISYSSRNLPRTRSGGDRHGGPGPQAHRAHLALWIGKSITNRRLAFSAWTPTSRSEPHGQVHPRGGLPFARPSLVRQKVRLLELAAGEERRIGYRNPARIFATRAQHRALISICCGEQHRAILREQSVWPRDKVFRSLSGSGLRNRSFVSRRLSIYSIHRSSLE
jgi:hypothetical protein